jgi:hypothetical protein
MDNSDKFTATCYCCGYKRTMYGLIGMYTICNHCYNHSPIYKELKPNKNNPKWNEILTITNNPNFRDCFKNK